MAVDIVIAGKPKWNVTNYTVTEDSTPIDPSDLTGGVGQFTFGIPEKSDAKRMRDKVVLLSDGTQGTTSGIARGLGGNGAEASITADSRMSALTVVRTAKPYSGTLGGAILYYLGLVGITDFIVIDSTVASRNVTFIGWNGVVWDQVKRLCSAMSIEVSLVSNNIVFRPLRQRIAVNNRDAMRSWALDSTGLAQSVEVLYYQPVQKTDLAYPTGGWSDQVSVIQVDAGETLELDIPLGVNRGETGLGVSLASVVQPVAVNSVDRYHTSSSVYCVAGNDGLPIPAAQWTTGGGSVKVAVNEDTRSLKLTVVGASESQYAPYRLGMTAGPSDFYSSLRIRGTGVFFNKQKWVGSTGHNVDKAPQEVGDTIDSEFIETYSDAARAGIWALARFIGPRHTITVSTTGINRKGVSGSTRYPTMGDANSQFAGLTMGQVNTLKAGLTMGEVTAEQFELVQADFDNQAFGNVAGARVLDDSMWHRIRNATISPSGIGYTAERDTTMGDANTVYAGMTMAQVNALRSGQTLGDFNTQPLLLETA